MSNNNRIVESEDDDIMELYEENLRGERFQRSQDKEKLQKFRKKNPGFKTAKS